MALSSITVRPLTAADVLSALRLSSEAGWNQREDDWLMAIEMTPGASFCATADDLLVATCIGIGYGEFSWIAMMLVDPMFQRQGLGERLLLSAMDALPSDRPIGLDATAVGRLLYTQHGFRDTTLLARRIAEHVRFEELGDDDRASAARATIRRPDSGDLNGIASIDRQVFGGDRRRVLEWTLAVEPDCCAVATVDGELAGYVFGRRGRMFSHLGTVVARSEPVAKALVRDVASRAPLPVGIDAFESLTGWTDWLAAAGFVTQRPLARMIRGSHGSRGSDRVSSGPIGSDRAGFHMFSIFGPEFA
jgi:ribosomal protein S18 acetylase RimI-like enzyme